MAKNSLVSLAVLILVASAALAADKTITIHHRHAAKPVAAAPAAAPAPAATAAAAPASPSFWGVGIADHELYIKNQHDSGLGQWGRHADTWSRTMMNSLRPKMGGIQRIYNQLSSSYA